MTRRPFPDASARLPSRPIPIAGGSALADNRPVRYGDRPERRPLNAYFMSDDDYDDEGIIDIPADM